MINEIKDFKEKTIIFGIKTLQMLSLSFEMQKRW